MEIKENIKSYIIVFLIGLFFYIFSFSVSDYWIWWDSIPFFLNTDHLYNLKYLRSETNMLWWLSTSSTNIVLFPTLHIIDLFRFLFWELLWQYIWNCWTFLFFIFSLHYFLWIFCKWGIRIVLTFFVVLSFITWFAIGRNIIFINSLFLFTPLLLRIFYEYWKQWNKKYLLLLLILSIFNSVVSLNPWTIAVQWITLLFFSLFFKIKLKNIFIAFLFLYITAIPSLIIQVVFLLNNNSIINDVWNNQVLMKKPLLEQQTTSWLFNILRWFNWDMYASWWYENYNNSKNFYYPFSLSKYLNTSIYVLISWIPILLVIYFFIVKKAKKYIWLLIFLIVVIFLMKSSAQPLWNIFVWCLENIPLFWIFRNPHQKFSIAYILIISVLLWIFLSSYATRKEKKVSLFFIIIYIIAFSWNYFVFWYIWEINKIKSIPNDYKTASDFLMNSGVKRLIILPNNEWTWINTNFWYEGYSLFHYLSPWIEIYNRNDSAFSSYVGLFNYQVFWSFWDKTSFINYIRKYNIDWIIHDKYINRYKRFWVKENNKIIENELKKLSFVKKKNFWNIDTYIFDKSLVKPVITFNNIKFYKYNPTNYSLYLEKIKEIQKLNFYKSYHPQWKLYLKPYSEINCSWAITYTWTLSPEVVWTGTYTTRNWDTLEKITKSITWSITYDITSLNPDLWTWTLKKWQGLLIPKMDTHDWETYNVKECPSENKFYVWWEISKLLQKPIFDDTHKLVYDYANSWTIDPEYIKANYPKEYYKENPDWSIDLRLTLYFKPQSYFYLGLIISWITFLLLVLYLIIDIVIRFRRKNK